MNAKDFDKIVASRMAWCNKTLCAKGDEYARDGDRLWNFKVAGRKLNCHPAEALAGMMVKHTVSVDDIIDGLAKGVVPPRELVAEKIGDSIDYLLLLEGLIEEERAMVEILPPYRKNRYLEKLRELRHGREQSATFDERANQPVPAAEPWQTAVSEQDARRREQAATSAQRREAMDTLASACGYTIPPLDDGDDDPVVHIVPDKTSRATLPSGCLGRLCGRGDNDEWRPCPEDAL